MIIVTRITSAKEETQMAMKASNILEISEYPEDTSLSWVKYWNGKEMRPCVVLGTVAEIAGEVNRISRKRDD